MRWVHWVLLALNRYFLPSMQRRHVPTDRPMPSHQKDLYWEICPERHGNLWDIDLHHFDVQQNYNARLIQKGSQNKEINLGPFPLTYDVIKRKWKVGNILNRACFHSYSHLIVVFSSVWNRYDFSLSKIQENNSASRKFLPQHATNREHLSFFFFWSHISKIVASTTTFPARHSLL